MWLDEWRALRIGKGDALAEILAWKAALAESTWLVRASAGLL